MKALIITGSLVQDHEFIYPYYRLKEENFEVITSLKELQPCKGILGTNIPPDKDARIIKYEDLVLDNYDLLVLPGGAKSMEYLRQEKRVLDFINAWDKEGKVIASICHGAQLLISAKVVSGRYISGYYSIKDDIINAGAYYTDEGYAVDDNIISSPHYKYLGIWMKKTLEVFNAKRSNS